MVRRALLTFALVGALAAPQGVSGQTSLGVDFTSVTTDFSNGSWSLGWSFNVLNPFSVNQLGFYDDLGNGLAESHEVGLWDPFGTLLASATVPSGTGSTLMGFFRMVNIAPITLSAGLDYRIAAVSGSERYTWDPNGLTTYADLQFGTGVYAPELCCTTDLLYPTWETADAGYFGPNLGSDEGILTSTAPEPVSVLRVGTGLLGVFVVRRRKQDELEIDEG
jgi:hypothetical protein